MTTTNNSKATETATRKEYIVVTHEENGTSKRAYLSKQLAFDAISEAIARGWTVAAAYERDAQMYTKENFPELY